MQLPQCVRGGHHAAGCGTTCTHSYERRGARVHVYMHVHTCLLHVSCVLYAHLITMYAQTTSYHAARSSALRVYSFDHARPRAHVRICLVSEYRRPHGRSRRTASQRVHACIGAIPSPHLHMCRLNSASTSSETAREALTESRLPSGKSNSKLDFAAFFTSP